LDSEKIDQDVSVVLQF